MSELRNPVGRPKGRLDISTRKGKKLEAAQVSVIRELWQKKTPVSQIKIRTEEMGYPKVSRTTIYNIVNRSTWKKSDDVSS